MVIVNHSSFVLTINGKKLDKIDKMTVHEGAFNSQGVFSNAGAVEIVTEYNKRTFRCYGSLVAYEDQNLKDSNGLPYIVIIDFGRI